jgi:hypothetical protein
MIDRISIEESAGTIRLVLDEFGRCVRCVELGFWKLDA